MHGCCLADQADLNNYRPISILPCVSKSMEKIVNKQLVNHLNVNGHLWGTDDFQSGYGCVTATTKVLNDITFKLDIKRHSTAILTLQKLLTPWTTTHSSINLAALISLILFSNYLSHWVQRVRFENLFSHSGHQGCTPRLYPWPYTFLNLY